MVLLEFSYKTTPNQILEKRLINEANVVPFLRKIKIVVESGGDSFYDVPMFLILFFFIYETIFQWRCSKCSRLLLLMVSLPNSNFLLSILGLFSWWRANSIYFIDPSPPQYFIWYVFRYGRAYVKVSDMVESTSNRAKLERGYHTVEGF